ncbi:MAG TPA: sigma-70 family RNA polymerase sigma factor [Gemmataceae bacterium]|nr:sigma-70 family RNA polymerase sigma factor [Gemmataceae bacterium]
MSSRTAAVLRHLTRAASDDFGASDRELLRRFAADADQTAFTALVRRHGPMVLGVCRRALHNDEDAEDACQATFVVLANKAGAGSWQASVANWLYATARKVAGNARVAAARRAKRDGKAAVPEAVPPLDQMTGRELLAVLDEELDRLPPRYREPLVLCYLQGLTRDEAAARLGVRSATLKSQLDRGRKRLGQALTRRGVALGAGLLACAATSRVGAVPARVLNAVLATVRDTTRSAVAELTRGVVVNGLVKKSALAVLAVVGLIGLGVGLGAVTPTAAGPPPDKTPPAAKTPADEKADTVEVTGRVIDPEGKPFAGATLYVWSRAAKKEGPRETSGKDGRFRVTVRRADVQDQAILVATAEGCGPDWLELNKSIPADREVTLRLASDDVPITGRLLNLEGKGIAGATVRVRRVEKRVNDGDLAEFIATKQKWARGDYVSGPEMKELRAAAFPTATSVTTDADGKFRLSGFGRERVVSLTIEGKAIEPIWVEVLTRTGPVKGLYSGNENDTVYGSSFERIISPGKAIIGTVREKGTGKPLAGIKVSCGRCAATTDAEGRYRIEGPRKKDAYTVTAYAVPYFDVTKSDAADTPGFEPVRVDFELERGLAIRGRVLDKVTGKSVQATITYLSFGDNPHLKTVSGLGPGGATGDDGSFAFTALPGPGILAVIADEDDYVKVAPDAGWKLVPGIRWIPGVAHAFARIDPSEKDPRSATFDIRLEPAASVLAEVVGPDDKPFSGSYYVAGQTASARHTASWMIPKSSPKFPVRGLQKSQSRFVVLLSKDLKLGKFQEVRADEAAPIQVRLESLSGVTGRVVDSDGRPLATLDVSAVLRRKPEDIARLPIQLQFDFGSWTKNLRRTTKTDSEGKFRLDGLMPGLRYTLAVSDGERELIRQESLSPPGAEKTDDLGELRVKRP